MVGAKYSLFEALEPLGMLKIGVLSNELQSDTWDRRTIRRVDLVQGFDNITSTELRMIHVLSGDMSSPTKNFSVILVTNVACKCIAFLSIHPEHVTCD